MYGGSCDNSIQILRPFKGLINVIVSAWQCKRSCGKTWRLRGRQMRKFSVRSSLSTAPSITDQPKFRPNKKKTLADQFRLD